MTAGSSYDASGDFASAMAVRCEGTKIERLDRVACPTVWALQGPICGLRHRMTGPAWARRFGPIYHNVVGAAERLHMEHAFWGPEYSGARHQGAIESAGLPVEALEAQAKMARAPAGHHPYRRHGRLQSVDPAVNSRYHALIRAVKARTGIGMVLNTSFNEIEFQTHVANSSGLERWSIFFEWKRVCGDSVCLHSPKTGEPAPGSD